MSDRRRSSLLDQMAMVAASQKLIEMEADDDDDEDYHEDHDEDHDDDDDHDDEEELLQLNDLPDLDVHHEDEKDDEDEGSLYRGAFGEHEEVSEIASHVGSEDTDEFERLDNPTPLEHQWNPRSSAVFEDSIVSDLEEFQMSSASDNWTSPQELTQNTSMEFTMENMQLHTQQKRSSFVQPPVHRRSSHAESEGSFHSAPARPEASPPLYGEVRMERRRPLSIAVPNAEGAAYSRRNSQRRSSVKIKSFTGGNSIFGGGNSSSNNEEEEETTSSAGSGLLNTIRGRRSTRRANLSIAQGKSGAFGNLDTAIESLRKQDSNSEWENVAAAAAVVAASSAGGNTKSRHIQFAVNDAVLVFLTLLNVTNMEDPKDTFTVAPVNKYGFTSGEGTTDQEKSGPYSFVLASVKHVHFDEDDRYYTIVRADTGTEQRADSGWMEPLKSAIGIDAAARAASKTIRSTQDKPIEQEDETGYFQDFVDFMIFCISWPADFAQSTLIPWYRQQRENGKQHITQILYGDAPFACKVRVTGINILVMCSLIFLFLEVINLAFFPASADHKVAIIGGVVWSILVLELVFEILIRPSGYQDLIVSEKAFAPSAARHINRFHLFFEAMALLTFIPEFDCLVDKAVCSRNSMFSRVQASLDSVLGDTHSEAAMGRFILGITTLRFFGVVRHWKKMWINNTFRPMKREGLEKWLFRQDALSGRAVRAHRTLSRRRTKKSEDENESMRSEDTSKLNSEEDQRLKNAATIGTALMVVNSHRALVLLTSIVIFMPIINSLTPQNTASTELARLLQTNNVEAGNDCEYLETAVNSWLSVAAQPQPESAIARLEDTYVLWAQLLPKRCDFQREDGVITLCTYREFLIEGSPSTCEVWDEKVTADPDEISKDYFANLLDIRVDAIWEFYLASNVSTDYNVTVIYNENPTVAITNMGLFFLLVGILILVLYGLQALRGDAIRLVLEPLQRMLSIVLRYAENPLSQDVRGDAQTTKKDDGSVVDRDEEIGNYETEQLINAITNIANLLRKCWGVAGAGIISSNLARTKDGKTVVFNPTVPGKRVYALFGFVAINGFGDLLRALDRDVMILINDVAKVVHDQVYRWALGDSGQCNKNLGAAFLMVFRIGDFSEVHDKKMRATNHVFRDHAKTSAHKTASLRRRKRGTKNFRQPYGRKRKNDDGDGTLQLASLPGIQSFTDRALLGMLKSFAGIQRDKSMNAWKNDFRLSAGVHDYNAEIIYGMDAGWAVEGAVGSEYKIDATYLSPHVNMASRMMSASKQYGVTILLSKAVEELLSRPCRKKLRHLDTVYVKGSKVKQDIFTYDARHQGVDFFLIERTPEQADMDAEAYTASIWEVDQDLRAMRQHVTDEFMDVFSLGVKQYLGGKWQDAYQNLQKADDMMIDTVLGDGYVDYNLDELEGSLYDRSNQSEEIVRIRNELGDGACHVLMSYMEKRKLTPPDDWDAVRALSSK